MGILAVLDTNVFVGACLGQGAAAQAVGACLDGRVKPAMGSALLVEHEDVLSRESLFATCRLSPVERQNLFDIYLSVCQWTRVYFAWRPNLPDEGDNHLIELAVAAGAAFVVTRNLRDLRRGELRFPGLRCLAPEEFLKEIG